MVVEHPFDLHGGNIFSAAPNDVFLPIHKKEKTVLVLPGVITRMKPAATHSFRCAFRVTIIANHQCWTLQEHLTHVAHWHIMLPIVNQAYPRVERGLRVLRWLTHTAYLAHVGKIRGTHGTFGKPIGLEHGKVKTPLKIVIDFHRHRSSTSYAHTMGGLKGRGRLIVEHTGHRPDKVKLGGIGVLHLLPEVAGT